MMKKTLTITVPSYNVERYLPETIPTLFQPEIIDELEILIVNDGSTDSTAEIANQLHEQYPDSVFVINKENGGHGSTLNTGIQRATGSYFRVIDGDDWVDPQAFVAYVRALRDLSADLVITPFNYVYINTGRTEKQSFDSVEPSKIYRFDDIINQLGMNYSIHSATYRTELIKQIPPISEHCFYVDVEYISYAVPLVESVAILKDVVYQYRMGEAGQSVSRNSKIKNRAMHKHVTNQILRFYEETDTSQAKRTWLRNRCAELIRFQLNVYLSMPVCGETKGELLAFSGDMKKRCPDLYKDVPGKAIQILKKTDNRGYVLAALLWRLKNN